MPVANETDGDVNRLSFKGCLRILQARLPECDSSAPIRLEQWYRLLMEEKALVHIEPRRNGVPPRVIKGKMSK